MKRSLLLISLALVLPIAAAAAYAQSEDMVPFDTASPSLSVEQNLPLMSGPMGFEMASPTAMPSTSYEMTAHEPNHTGRIVVSSTTLPLGLAVAQGKTSEAGMFG